MAHSGSSGNGPSPSRRERRFRLSRPAVVLAVTTSGAVLYAGAVGAFSATVAVAAACGAGLIAAISMRHARPLAEPLAPLSEAPGEVVVNAPRASEVAGVKAGHTDAA